MGKSYPFYNTTIGFDKLFDELSRGSNQTNNFPPHNIIKEDETNYKIELAVAGYSEDLLEVSFDDGTLTVKTLDVETNAIDYIHKGITSKFFSKEFILADEMVVDSVSLDNGILSVNMSRVVPEEKKPRVIPINTAKQLLTEDEYKQYMMENV